MNARTKKIIFTKMQAIGNDAIVIDCLKGIVNNPNHLARKLCHRRIGIGADQLLLLTKSRKCDFGMRVFNADGSEAEMCGNGLRCLARYISDKKYSAKKELLIETAAGPRHVKVTSKVIHIDMDEPIVKGKDIPVNLSGRIVNRPLKVNNKDFRITCLSVGNPHCIIFQEDLPHLPVDLYGPLLETHAIFPKKANISFANVVSDSLIQARVWERGVGETLGCGSAACAIGVASVLNGFTNRKVSIEMPGGKLEVEWNHKNNHVWLRGPADIVYSGEIKF